MRGDVSPPFFNFYVTPPFFNLKQFVADRIKGRQHLERWRRFTSFIGVIVLDFGVTVLLAYGLRDVVQRSLGTLVTKKKRTGK